MLAAPDSLNRVASHLSRVGQVLDPELSNKTIELLQTLVRSESKHSKAVLL